MASKVVHSKQSNSSPNENRSASLQLLCEYWAPRDSAETFVYKAEAYAVT